ncbi:hypothetical protein, partial [Nocardia abscessus]|uniref:hypothetical protein n=1 Tax=Nocardia abscessus TaxID=120957 RepID=UPI003CC7CD7B
FALQQSGHLGDRRLGLLRDAVHPVHHVHPAQQRDEVRLAPDGGGVARPSGLGRRDGGGRGGGGGAAFVASPPPPFRVSGSWSPDPQ